MSAALEQITRALLNAQQTMGAMRQQFDAELRVMNAERWANSRNRRTFVLFSRASRRRRWSCGFFVTWHMNLLAVVRRSARRISPARGKVRSVVLARCERRSESPPEGTVDRLIIEETKLDQAPDKIPRPQPGHHDFACYPSVEESHEGPVYASSEAHARQQGLPGVGEDAREVEGPLEASSEAHARQQGLPGVGEQDAREVGGYDDDEADYGDNDSEASQGPASDAQCWLGDPSDLNDPRWAQMSVAAKFGLGKKAMRDSSCTDAPADRSCKSRWRSTARA